MNKIDKIHNVITKIKKVNTDNWNRYSRRGNWKMYEILSTHAGVWYNINIIYTRVKKIWGRIKIVMLKVDIGILALLVTFSLSYVTASANWKKSFSKVVARYAVIQAREILLCHK